MTSMRSQLPALFEALADDGEVSAQEIVDQDLCGKLQALARVEEGE